MDRIRNVILKWGGLFNFKSKDKDLSKWYFELVKECDLTSPIQPQMTKKVGSKFKRLSELVKIPGDYLKNKKAQELFESIHIMLEDPTKKSKGSFWFVVSGKKRIGLIHINPERILKEHGLNEKEFHRTISHELLHAVEWCYEQAEKKSDYRFPEPKNEKEFLTLPHELRAYALNSSQHLKGKSISTWEEFLREIEKDPLSKRQLEAMNKSQKKIFLRLLWKNLN